MARKKAEMPKGSCKCVGKPGKRRKLCRLQNGKVRFRKGKC